MEALKQVVNESEASKAIFRALSKRLRFRRHTNIQFFQYQLQTVSKEEILSTFKRLQTLGLGLVVYGRGKNPDKFLWYYNLKDISQLAQGKKTLDQCQRFASVTQQDAPELNLVKGLKRDRVEALIKMLQLIID